MTPLPPPLGQGEVILWRLDLDKHAPRWSDGEGARLYGGRWNPRGRRAIYGSLDPSTAILEVAVHRGFAVLDAAAHTLTRAHLADPTRLHVLAPDAVPEEAWLRPGLVSETQQQFGAQWLDESGAFVVPSAVSTNSWNVVLGPMTLAEIVGEVRQERFVLDPRLNAHL